MLLLVVADLNRRTADALVTVKSGNGTLKRALHVSQGCLVSADSNLKAERLGDMLAGEGRLDPVLIEPVANEARRRGTLLGDQLVEDGLLTSPDLVAALERQARLRLHSALACSGCVSIGRSTSPQGVTRLPLGAAVTVAFRDGIGLEAIKALVADRPTPGRRLDLEDEAFKRLELGPTGLKICQALAGGQPLEAIVNGSTAPEGVQRMAGVLVALGLWA